ncbi:MAG: RnfH family protein [Moraxellaceae bacterium]|nr:RnfH family protein [Moraxellaceae bacterium]MDZ4386115.1 RnfH family protein [Moraxellaceae bacterium]
MIKIEVAYATAEQQWLAELSVAPGTSALQAVEQAIANDLLPANLVLADLAIGVWSKVLKSPQSYSVKINDRVELYRPLTLDPMEIRKVRAAKARTLRTKTT